MNFKTHNDDPTIDGLRTSLQYRDHKVSHARIVEVFGEPMVDEPNWEWCIRFDDGKMATIYSWPTNHCGGWNIGGPDKWTAYRVIDLLNGNPIQE
jgi:hypothetical protein